MVIRISWLAAVTFALGLSACNQGETMNKADAASLVQAERMFAANAKTHGIGPGFVGVLDSAGVVFQPGPVNGLSVYKELAPSAEILAWRPVYAEIASSGDLGYTTGPWEYFSDSANLEPVAFGEYISVWRRNANAEWRLVLDIGSFRGRLVVDTSLKEKTLTAAGNTTAVTPDDLLMRDRAFAAKANTDERETVYAEAVADDTRLMRTGHGPKVGRAAISSWLSENSLIESTFPEAAFLSEAGDLGYAYGRAELTVDLADTTGGIAHGGYARIWRRVGDRWKLALEVFSVRPGALAALSPTPSN